MQDNATPFINSFGKRKRLKKRFHEESRLRYRVNDMNSLLDNNYELLIKYINHHREIQQPRLIELQDYARGDNHTILEYNRVKNKEMADNRLVHNFGDLVATFIQGYIAGKEIIVEYYDEELEEEENATINDFLHEVDRQNNTYQLNRSLIKTIAETGRAYDYVYQNQEDKIRIRKFDVRQTFVIYDNTHAEHSVAAVRYYPKTQFTSEDDNTLIVEVYGNDNYIYLLELKQNELFDEDIDEYAVNQIQITEYLGNELGIGAYETHLSKIDAYDAAQSDTANYMQDISDAILMIKGLMHMPRNSTPEQQIDWLQKMLQSRLMHLKPPTDQDNKPVGDVDAKFLQKSYDSGGAEAFKTRLKDDIHAETGVPNLSDEKFGGVQTGEAVRQKMFGLDQRIIDTMAHFEKSLKRRYELIGYLGVENGSILNFNIDHLDIRFTLNLPKALKEAIEAFNALGGEMSNETILEITNITDNVSQELERLKKEKIDDEGLIQNLAKKQRMTDLAVNSDAEDQTE
ncbi:phage portal protein [Facklamia sp. P9177]|uniref:phage portal protein n=1 Tax=unclassified Facklamia TaxID=2622293 RepID=UPI003D16C619